MNFKSASSIILMLAMVLLTIYAAWYILDIESMKADSALFPEAKNESLFNTLEREAYLNGVPVIYENIQTIAASDLISSESDINGSSKSALIVSMYPIMDEFGNDRIGILKKYQFKVRISEVKYYAPEFYNITAYSGDHVVLHKDVFGIEERQAFSALGWLMGMVILGLLLLLYSQTPESPPENKKE